MSTPHRHHSLVLSEVQRIRPVGSVVLAVLVVAPSLWECATGNLSAVALLGRLALALPVCAVMVWAATGVALHYARVQARSQAEADPVTEMDR